MSLFHHNSAEIPEIKKIRDEVKWYIGEKLGYDPSTTEEGRKMVEEYLAGVIVSGAGEWLAKQIKEE